MDHNNEWCYRAPKDLLRLLSGAAVTINSSSQGDVGVDDQSSHQGKKRRNSRQADGDINEDLLWWDVIGKKNI